MRAFFTCSMAIAVLSASALAFAQSGDRVGTFKEVQGETWVGPAAARQAAVSGEGVKAADQLTTGKTGSTTITLKDGTVLIMGPNSTMNLRAFDFNSTTQEGNFALDLLRGSVRVITGLIGKSSPEKFKIHTPTSVVGVRGTDFIVQTEAAQ